MTRTGPAPNANSYESLNCLQSLPSVAWADPLSSVYALIFCFSSTFPSGDELWGAAAPSSAARLAPASRVYGRVRGRVRKLCEEPARLPARHDDARDRDHLVLAEARGTRRAASLCVGGCRKAHAHKASTPVLLRRSRLWRLCARSVVHDRERDWGIGG